jgi:adenylosuccinate synthase
VRTILIDPMVVHPTALLTEAEALGRVGVHDALSRLKIDARCRVTTPFHQAAGRLREYLRGAAAHGTCGVGVGETVRHGLEHPELILRYADLGFPSSALADKLNAIRESLLGEFSLQRSATADMGARQELQVLHDETTAGRWLVSVRALARQCPPEPADVIRLQLEQPGCVLFEGAQGALLDEWRGFHPHTTWSSISASAVEKSAARFGLTPPIEHYGVLRSYLTRHGIGPLPTHDESLDQALSEPHNSGAGWQGRFRRGHPDAVLLRYALDTIGKLSGLFVSHLDAFQRGVMLKWCEGYSFTGPYAPDLRQLPLSADPDLVHQARLTERLQTAQPEYALAAIDSAGALLDRIASVTNLPFVLGSFGTTFDFVCDAPAGA